jgi:hypothetical protein
MGHSGEFRWDQKPTKRHRSAPADEAILVAAEVMANDMGSAAPMPRPWRPFRP